MSSVNRRIRFEPLAKLLPPLKDTRTSLVRQPSSPQEMCFDVLTLLRWDKRHHKFQPTS